MVKSHSTLAGYLAWLFGVFGAHRFYYGKPISGVLWLFTLGLCGIGWIIDLFLIPSMDAEANHRFRMGEIDYTTAWVLLLVGGVFGFHRFYFGEIVWGILYLVTGGLLGIGIIYDVLTLNDQIAKRNYVGQVRRVHMEMRRRSREYPVAY